MFSIEGILVLRKASLEGFHCIVIFNMKAYVRR